MALPFNKATLDAGLFPTQIQVIRQAAYDSALMRYAGTIPVALRGGTVVPSFSGEAGTVIGAASGDTKTVPNVENSAVTLSTKACIAWSVFDRSIELDGLDGIADQILAEAPNQITKGIDKYIVQDTTNGFFQSGIPTVTKGTDSMLSAIAQAVGKVAGSVGSETGLSASAMIFSTAAEEIFWEEAGTNGFPIFWDPTSESGAPVLRGRLNGRPVAFSPMVSGTLSSKNIIGIVGDFSKLCYGFATQVLVDRFDQGSVPVNGQEINLPMTNNVAYRTEVYFGAGIINKNAFCIITE